MIEDTSTGPTVLAPARGISRIQEVEVSVFSSAWQGVRRLGARVRDVLFEPVASIKDPAQRRQARLLSIFLLCQFLLLLAIAGAYTLAVPGYRLPLAHQMGTLVWLALYAFSRRGHTRLAMIILLPLYPLMAIMNIMAGIALDIPGTLAYLLPSIVLASMFLSPLETAIYGTLTTALIVSLPIIAPERVPGFPHIVGIAGAGAIMVLLLVIGMVHRDQLEHDRQEDLKRAYDGTLEGWARALELRDKSTEGHSRRVATMTIRLARACGLRGADLEAIYRGALLHDIGKMGLPDAILGKNGNLTPEERKIMQTHPRIAMQLLSSTTFLKSATDIPAYHHEWWDGTGYPFGLKGEEIPLAARIFEVVDAWDALLSERPYRKAWSREQVIRHLKSYRGVQFDPHVVDRFLQIVG